MNGLRVKEEKRMWTGKNFVEYMIVFVVPRLFALVGAVPAAGREMGPKPPDYTTSTYAQDIERWSKAGRNAKIAGAALLSIAVAIAAVAYFGGRP